MPFYGFKFYSTFKGSISYAKWRFIFLLTDRRVTLHESMKP